MGKIYAGVNGNAEEIVKIYVGNNAGKARRIRKVYAGMNGVAELIWEGGILPSTYQQVEYIESSGTQYIDTGVPAKVTNDAGLVVRLDMEFVTVPSNGVIFGVRNTTGNTRISCGYYSGKWSLGYGNYYTGGTAATAGTKYLVYMMYTIGSQRVIVSGTDMVTRTDSTERDYSGKTFYIFRCNAASSSNANPTSMRLYYCHIIQNGRLRQFYPCYRRSDHAVGLYDMENGVFYGNAGTGAFTAGPDYVGELP